MLSFVRLLKKFVQLQLFVEKATGDRQKVYPPLAGYTWAPFENSFLFLFSRPFVTKSHLTSLPSWPFCTYTNLGYAHVYISPGLQLPLLGHISCFVSPSTTLCGHLRLTPNLIGHLPHQGQFGTLVVVGQGVPALVGAEAALGADADPLEGLLAGLPGPLRDEVGGLVDLGLGGLLVLELAQFRADATHDDVLVPGEEFERFEPSGPLGVVFQVEGVDVEVLEQPLGDDVVGPLGEVSAPDEVAPAQVDARVEVGGQAGDGVVVQLDVGVQKLVDRPDVVLVLLPTLAEGVGTEIFLVRIRQIMSPGGKKDGKEKFLLHAKPGSSN